MPAKHILTLTDGYKTAIYQQNSKSENPHASILILHGMAEHQERYQEFAAFLCEMHFDVFTYNHRGHGPDKNWEDLGFFSDKHGFQRVVLDAIEILHYIKDHSRSGRLILFGHSMGSLISRNVIQYYDSLDGVVLCGTTFPPAYASSAGLLLAKCISAFRGARHRSKFMHRVLFEGRRYTKISERTKFDWLTRDNQEVGRYIHDPFCGFVCTASLYYDMIKLAKKSSNCKLMKRTRRSLPLLMISGTKDPVGNFGKEVTALYHAYQKLGFQTADCILYDGCRHELLNELNRAAIMRDVCQWINDKILLPDQDHTGREPGQKPSEHA